MYKEPSKVIMNDFDQIYPELLEDVRFPKFTKDYTEVITVVLIECFHSRGQHLCKFIRTKEIVCIRKEFNSQRIGLGHQHGRRFIVLGHQYGRRDVMWKHSIGIINTVCIYMFFLYMLLEEFVHTFILIEVILNIRECKKKLEKVCEVMKIESI